MAGQGGATQNEREAAAWIARLEAADVSLEDHRRFRAWLAQSAENRAAYEALSRTWDKLDALKYLKTTVEHGPAPAQSRRWLIGAGFGGVFAAAAAAWLLVPRPTRAAIFETPVGGRRTVTLEDASAIELNAASRLSVAYGDAERRVIMERGEALFDIRPDPARPFRVLTPFGEFRVMGTLFALKLSPGAARATVLRGAVAAAGPAPMATAHANQEVALSAGGAAVAVISAEAGQRRLSWRDGMLAFDGESLREAALDVERQTGVHFVFADAAVAELRIGGYIEARNAEAFLDLLRSNLDVSVERSGDSVTLSRR